jgi:hypothetical protein
MPEEDSKFTAPSSLQWRRRSPDLGKPTFPEGNYDPVLGSRTLPTKLTPVSDYAFDFFGFIGAGVVAIEVVSTGRTISPFSRTTAYSG